MGGVDSAVAGSRSADGPSQHRGGQAPGGREPTASQRRLNELVANASSLVEAVQITAETDRNLHGMLAIAHLLGFLEGVAAAGQGAAADTEAPLLEVMRLAALLAERMRLSERRVSQRRSVSDRRSSPQSGSEERMVLLPVAVERRHTDRRQTDRRHAEPRQFAGLGAV